jgi:hypothetical protein
MHMVCWKQVVLPLPVNMLATIEELAQDEERTRNAQIRQLLREALATRGAAVGQREADDAGR